MCERNGVTCSGHGSCGPATIGCVCDSDKFQGEYCEIANEILSTNDAGKPIYDQYVMTAITLVFVIHFFI